MLRKLNRTINVLWLLALFAPASASLLGLNQIVTPDIQPEGELSISVFGVNKAAGNELEMQIDLGLSPSCEISVSRSFVPGQTETAIQVGLASRGPFLLSVGTWSAHRGIKSQPFILSGWREGKSYTVAGIQKEDSTYSGVFGTGYTLTPVVSLAVGWITGPGNYLTVGCDVNLSPSLSFNPALFIANDAPHQCYGYGALTWTVTVW